MKLIVLITFFIVSISNIVFSQTIPLAGLQAWYPFTTNALDVSGNNNNGTVYGATLTTDRFNVPNHAYEFDGTNSYIDFGNVLNNVFSGSKFTLSFWIMPYNYMSNGIIFSKHADLDGCSKTEYQAFCRIYNNAFNFTYCGITAGGSARFITLTSPIPNYNEWYCVVVTYDGTINTGDGLDRVKIFMNGVQQSATLYPSPMRIVGNIGVAPAHMSAGNYLTSDGTPCQYSTFFHGKIDDIAVYNRILTSQETQNFCNAKIFTVAVVSTNVNCNNQCTGTATATPTGGTGTCTYSWNTIPVQTTQIATGLCAGTYTVTVTDATSSTTTSTVTITQPTAITVTTKSTSTSCIGNTGTATVTPSGGTQGYTYKWNNGQTTQTAIGLASGNYSATVTDANGCTKTQTVAVTSVNNTLSVSTFSTQTECAVTNGTAIAIVSNGSTPYIYNWSNGQTTQTATGLAVGNYTVTVTDANGCTQTKTATITQSTTSITLTINSTPTIPDGNTGTATAIVSGGTPNYFYNWNNGQTTQTATGLAVGTYTVTVIDANGCTQTQTVNVEILCGEIFIPTAFSPNKDGQNELECVFSNCIKELYFAIYDRLGEKVFETTDQKICWDGTYKNKLMNTAVFVYYLEATLTNKEKIIKKGNISLIR